MKTILMSAYAVNPYKGSEDGMGWNFALEAAKCNKVIAITRKNNQAAIDAFYADNKAITHLENLRFLYFDYPQSWLFWKKGALLSLVYFYIWQLSLPSFIRKHKIEFDVAHNLNFHNDWTPSFLWLLGKPLVWGPIGHHPSIPFPYLRKYGIKAILRDRALWCIKWLFWLFDPFLWICRFKASKILCMNSSAVKKTFISSKKVTIIPSVAVELPQQQDTEKKRFSVLIAARMVYLKGFDIAIKSFAKFYHSLPSEARTQCLFRIVGDGPELPVILQAIKKERIVEAVEVLRWIDRPDLLHIYNKTSVFLFPSFEGAGMVVAEAMSCGVPVVCFDNSGPGELTPANSQLKVNYGDYDQTVYEFAVKLSNLYFNEDHLTKESALAKKHFIENHSWACRGLQLNEIYHDILGKKPRLKLAYSSYFL